MIFYTVLDENSNRAVEHDAAYALLSRLLKRFYGISDFRIERGEHGKPFLAEYPDVHFNISHCRGLAVCGISNGEIGVDAEYIRARNDRVMRRSFSENERKFVSCSENPDIDFFRIWTLREALGKAMGTGIFSGLKNYSFDISGENPKCENSSKIFTQIILQSKWIVSVCADDPENEFVQIRSEA